MSDNHKSQRSVFVYIVILFTVAFILILYSFLMNHRSNQQMLGELQSSVNTLQSLEDAEEDKQALRSELEEANKSLTQLKDQLKDSEDGRKLWQNTANAMLLLDGLEQLYDAKDYDACEEVLKALEPLAENLPQNATRSDVISPTERYQTIAEALQK